ncbi:MAG: SCP2 sterol-binding domain-containing protein [Myxococcota bacterium]
MAEFPSDPISPNQFMEEFVPALMAEASIPEEADVTLGIRLDGADGGEWTVSLAAGKASVERQDRDQAVLTLVQTVDDWRGALWEGRGGVFGQQAVALFTGGGDSGSEQGSQLGALSALASLNGLIRVRVTEEEASDWATGFKLGPGPIPEEPTTEIEIASEDAQAMQDGTLDPMQAFMSGKIRVTGDMALMMQMQAVLMAAGS